eukprot:887931-Amphidinium_carterae.1
MVTLASRARSAGATSQRARVPGETWVPLQSSHAGRKPAGKKAEKGKPPASKARVHYQLCHQVPGPEAEPLALTRS